MSELELLQQINTRLIFITGAFISIFAIMVYGYFSIMKTLNDLQPVKVKTGEDLFGDLDDLSDDDPESLLEFTNYTAGEITELIDDWQQYWDQSEYKEKLDPRVALALVQLATALRSGDDGILQRTRKAMESVGDHKCE